MKEFLKAQTAAIIATLVDYSVFWLLWKGFSVWYLPASITGIIMGGIVNFVLGRNWAFDAKEGAVGNQGVRFLAVWLGSFAFNTGGLYLLTQLLGEQYSWISKIVVSIIVGIGYNYVLQKFFVFKKENGQLAKA